MKKDLIGYWRVSLLNMTLIKVDLLNSMSFHIWWSI